MKRLIAAGLMGSGVMRRAAGWLLASVVAILLLAPGAQAYVYWANYDGTSIARANLDGSGAKQSFISVAKDTDGVAVNGAHIYWANYADNAIGRARLDGSHANPTFITNGVSGPAGVAVDGAHLYFANTNSGAIVRVNLDGSGPPNTGFIPGGNYPGGVAVDGAHVYWTNQGNDTIGRANLSGSVVNQNFITGANTPYGVAVDGAHIYWTNFGGTDTIGRANLDGSGVDESFVTGANRPAGVAVDGAHIYWANFGMGTDGAIGRANLNGSGVDESFVASANGPAGVAVDALPVRATISALSETHPVFAVGGRSTPLVGRTARRIPRGTTFSFRLDYPAVARVRIQRKLRGRRVGGVCKPPTRRLRHHRSCTRLVTKATLRRNASVGLNRIAFSGRIRGRALPPGRYRAAFTATNPAGTSRTRALSFTIVKP